MSTKGLPSKLLFSILALVLVSISLFAWANQNQAKAYVSENCDVYNSASPADNAAFGFGSCYNKLLKAEEALNRLNASPDAISTTYLSGPIGAMVYSISDGILGQESFLLSDASPNTPEANALLLGIIRERNKSGGLNGVVTAINKQILNQKPLSGVDFIEQKVYALTHPGEVRAQEAYYRGTGFDLLRPVQSFWGWTVNIVYGLLIFIIIGVAFAIMFRNQIGDGIAISIQTAIPNIALAMLLVPLSYAISGLIVDGMTLGLNVTQQFLLGPGAPARDVYEARETEFPCDLINRTRSAAPVVDSSDDCDPTAGLGADDVRVSWLYASANLNYADEIYGATQDLPLVLGINDTLTELLGWMAGGISAIVNLIIGIVLLLTGLRIFWYLLNKFTLFILGPIFAPFFFAAIAIPGQGINAAMQYIKLLSSASLAFIITYAMTLLSLIFSSGVFQSRIAGLGFSAITPPLLAFENLLASSAGSQVPVTFINLYTALISMAIYLMIPKALQSMDAALGTDQMMPAFITDVFDSAKESINLGRQGLNVARNAPSNITGAISAAKSVPGRAQRRLNQSYQSALNIADRARGIRPGEQGSAAFRRAKTIRDRIDDLEAKRARAMQDGNVPMANIYEARISNEKKAMEGLQASEFGGGNANLEKLNEAQKLSVDVKWNADSTGGFIVMKEGDIKELKRIANDPATAHSPYRVPGAGKIVLKPEGFSFTPKIANRITVYSQRDPLPDANVNAPVAKTEFAGGSVKDRLSAAFRFRGGIPFAIFADIDFSDPHQSPNGDGSWEIGFAIIIRDPGRLVNTFRFGPGNYLETPKNFIRVNDIPGSARGYVQASSPIQLALQAAVSPLDV